MSDNNWDWWFGDEPHRGSLNRPSKSRRRRRLAIAAGLAVAMASCAGASMAWADETDTSGLSLPPSIWSADTTWSAISIDSVTFGMLDQDSIEAQRPAGTITLATHQTDNDDPDVAPQGDLGQQREIRQRRLNDLLRDDALPMELLEERDRSSDEDRARRERLRDLLRDDEPRDSDASSQVNDEEDQGVFATPFIADALPEVIDGVLTLPPLRAVSIATKPIGNGEVPDDFVASEDLRMVALPEDGYSRGQLVVGTVVPWVAPNTFSHPLYFEDRMLERHGHERWGCMQPIAAGARFFTTIPMLPYLATLQDPCDTVYSVGYYRAGSPVPRFMQRPPYQRRAALVEAASIATGMIALP
ncbi:MAG: hypothetical protein AAF745_00100 [Planctomycetota bacterium]